MEPESNVPNLDAMEPDELWEWARATHAGGQWSNPRGNRARARELFPERPAGYVRATRKLGAYASNKATAMRCRLTGDIAAALGYEAICDRIYSDLPEWARW